MPHADAHDARHGLHQVVTRDTLVQDKSGLPIFVGVTFFAVKAVTQTIHARGERPGNGGIRICDDAHGGGTHLDDMRLVRPYFHDGRWKAEDVLDNDGTADMPLPIRVAPGIQSDRIVLDFAGTAPRCRGPVDIARPLPSPPPVSRSSTSFRACRPMPA